MGAVYLALLYLATAAALTLAVRALRLDGAGRGRRAGWRGVTPLAAILLALLPLAYTAAGFLPGRALAPTPLLAGVAPWADPELEARVAAGAEPANPLLLDPLTQMLPWRRAAREGLLFNPAQGGGAALLGNGQSALLFPTEALARLLTPFRAVTFSQAARLLLAAWGMFLLARRLALSEPAALVAAAVYLGSGFLQLWRLHPHSLVAAVAPWIVAALLALVRRPGARPAIALAAAGVVGVLGGHPETLLHALLFALLLAALVAWRWRKGGRAMSGRGWGKVLAWGTAAALLAWMLAAPLLMPMVENLTVSAEWTLHRAERRQLHVGTTFAGALDRLAPAAALLVHGDPRRDNWIGPENLAELGGGALGGGALLLVPLALSGRRRRLAAALLALGGLGLLVAAHTPWLVEPFTWLPLLRDSLLKRLTLWWALAAALAAALAVERLRRAGSGRGAGMAGWLTGSALLVGALVAGVAFAHLGPETPRLLAWELGGLAAAVAGAALLAAGPRRGGASTGVSVLSHVGSGTGAVEEVDRVGDESDRSGSPPAAARPAHPSWRRPLAALLLAAALVVPRVGLFDGWVPATSADSFYPESLATRFVAERLAELEPAGWRVAGLDAALVPHSAAFFGFEEVRSYDPMALAPLYHFQGALGEPDRNGWVRLLDPARPALAFLGVRYVFDHPSMTHRPGVEVVYLGRDAIVYENPRALPRLFVPAAIEVHGDRTAALGAAVAIDDYTARAVAAGRVLDLDLAGDGAAVRRPNGRAEVVEVEVESGRVRAVVEAEEPALVASSQPAIPGWRVTVGGEPATPVRVNGAFLGIEVPAGRHAVELDYAPASWRLGLWLAAAGAVIAFGMVAVPAARGRGRRRRRGGLSR